MPTTRDVATLAAEAPTSKAAAVEQPGLTRAALMLLRLVRAAQPISRAELARRLGVNRSTVTDAFKPLITAGVVCEEPLPQTSRAGRGQGRPPMGLSFNSARDFFIGVNVGVRCSQ